MKFPYDPENHPFGEGPEDNTLIDTDCVEYCQSFTEGGRLFVRGTDLETARTAATKDAIEETFADYGCAMTHAYRRARISGGNGESVTFKSMDFPAGGQDAGGCAIYPFDAHHPIFSVAYFDMKAGDDTVWGTSGRDVVFAGSGYDEVVGFGGDDVICGGEDGDYLLGGYPTGATAGNVYGRTYACGLNRLLMDGNDVIWGEGGNDQIHGGNGRDVLHGGDGWDCLRGDGDLETASLCPYDEEVFDDSTDWLFGGFGGEASSLFWCDDLYGEGGADVLYGGAGAVRLSGDVSGDGVTTRVGPSGADWLFTGWAYADEDALVYANAGDDVICVGEREGPGVVSGGLGEDIVCIKNAIYSFPAYCGEGPPPDGDTDQYFCGGAAVCQCPAPDKEFDGCSGLCSWAP